MEFDFSQLENYVAPIANNCRWFVQWNSYTYDKSSPQYGQWQDAKNWNTGRFGSDEFGGHTSEIMAHAYAAEASEWGEIIKPSEDTKQYIRNKHWRY